MRPKFVQVLNISDSSLKEQKSANAIQNGFKMKLSKDVKNRFILILLIMISIQITCCTGVNRIHEIGTTSVEFSKPGLINTYPLNERNHRFQIGLNNINGTDRRGTTSEFTYGDDTFRPAFKNNLTVENDAKTLQGSALNRLGKNGYFYFYGQASIVAEELFTTEYIGLGKTNASEHCYLSYDAGVGVIDVYLSSVKYNYSEEEVLFILGGGKTLDSTVTVNKSKLTLFPHFGLGLDSKVIHGISLGIRSRILYVPDIEQFGIGNWIIGVNTSLSFSLIKNIKGHLDIFNYRNSLIERDNAMGIGIGISN